MLRIFNIVLYILASFIVINAHKDFVIVIPSYNNARYCIKNLKSVFDQDYCQYRILYIDDCSQDSTVTDIKKYISQRNQEHRVTLICNKIRQGAMANHYRAAHLCKPSEIIVHLDGDDWFAHNQVLRYLNSIYADPNVWLTYGQYCVYPKSTIPSCCSKLPQWVIDAHAYREYPFVTSHLRTFYAGLFHRIKLKDLLYKGKFLSASCDVGFMLPMLEMAHAHAYYIDKILYIYNAENPINDYKVNKAFLDLIAYTIRDRKPYKPLYELPHEQIYSNYADYVLLSYGDTNKLERILYQLEYLALNKHIILYPSGKLDTHKLKARHPNTIFLPFEPTIYDLQHTFSRALDFSESPYILCLDENYILQDYYDIALGIKMLAQTHASSIFFGIAKQELNMITPSIVIGVTPIIYAWQEFYRDAGGLSIYGISLGLYRKSSCLKLWRNLGRFFDFLTADFLRSQQKVTLGLSSVFPRERWFLHLKNNLSLRYTLKESNRGNFYLREMLCLKTK